MHKHATVIYSQYQEDNFEDNEQEESTEEDEPEDNNEEKLQSEIIIPVYMLMMLLIHCELFHYANFVEKQQLGHTCTTTCRNVHSSPHTYILVRSHTHSNYLIICYSKK